MCENQLLCECRQFLIREAELLDSRRLDEWLNLLTNDITYRVPRRVTRERGAEEREFSEEAFHFKDDKGILKTRVKRFESDYAWSENPPSQTRRIVSNVRTHQLEDDEIKVKSNFILYLNRYDSTDPDLIVGTREDILRRVNESLKIAERIVYLDHTAIGIQSFSVFL